MIFNSFWSIPNSVKCAVVRVMARDLGAATTHVAHVGTRTGIDAFTQVEDIHWEPLDALPVAVSFVPHGSGQK